MVTFSTPRVLTNTVVTMTTMLTTTQVRVTSTSSPTTRNTIKMTEEEEEAINSKSRSVFINMRMMMI